MQHTSQGIDNRRVASLVAAAVERLELDLTGLRVLTEGATGPYVVTPVIAALGGAHVVAFTKDSRYGTVAQVRRETAQLADGLGVKHRIHIVEDLTDQHISRADIVTNSAHLRPLDAAFVDRMKPSAVIPLMYESWESRPQDVDLEACQRRGIAVAGTSEAHPNVRVFDYLGMAALYGLLQCGVPAPVSRLLLIADNAFAPYIARTLAACGAALQILAQVDLPPDLTVLRRAADVPGDYDAVIVAEPGPRPVIGRSSQARYRPEQIGKFFALVQIYGEVEREALGRVTCCPPEEPRRGHMGINLCQLGPEPVIRLQAGGLKVGQVLTTGPEAAPELMEYCQPLPVSFEAPGSLAD